ncbi:MULTISPECIES: AEC family transporter [unclassified Crossiella]|uniref:AEC family transporter n=1 Tax=unclassified Crossiella TaxID=2620835 RepID=UPI001FFF66E1|nr:MULTISPECIES: AEC family transporter [unclassified Crossiella]MCK2243379.1 AEC family transporter [Crossiella sp. S99.2]MCK2254152.1 AEC family transporter [Crossiella sp. S99.1]
MPTVVAGFVPIWALTGVGYLVRRTNLFGLAAERALTRVVFYLAMPAVLFTTLSRVSLDGLASTSILAFAVSTVLVGAIGLAASRWLFHRRLADQAIGGMSSAYVNAANLGIPVAITVLGDPSFVVAALMFQLLFVMPTVLTLIDTDLNTGATGRFRRVLLLPVRNPVILGAACGLAMAALGWQIPPLLAQPLDLLGAAGVPLALLVLGMSLFGRGQSADLPRRSEVLLVVLLKIVLQPLVCFLIGHFAFGLTGPPLLAAVLFAALPTAQNAFVFASQYELRAGALARDAILLTTLLSMASLTLVAYLLA